MEHRIFTVFDEKAKAYLPPFVLAEVGMALRIFGDCVNSKDHQFGKHPHDYTLFAIGCFDDSTGTISELNNRGVVANGAQVVNVEAPVEQEEFPVGKTNSGGPEVSMAEVPYVGEDV